MTGISDQREIERYPFRPDEILGSVAELVRAEPVETDLADGEEGSKRDSEPEGDHIMDDRTLWLIVAFVITAGTLVAFIVQWRRSRRGGQRSSRPVRRAGRRRA